MQTLTSQPFKSCKIPWEQRARQGRDHYGLLCFPPCLLAKACCSARLGSACFSRCAHWSLLCVFALVSVSVPGRTSLVCCCTVYCARQQVPSFPIKFGTNIFSVLINLLKALAWNTEFTSDLSPVGDMVPVEFVIAWQKRSTAICMAERPQSAYETRIRNDNWSTKKVCNRDNRLSTTRKHQRETARQWWCCIGCGPTGVCVPLCPAAVY